MGAKAKAEAAAHAVTLEKLAAERLTNERLHARIRSLEEEAEAQRELIAVVAAGGPRAGL